MKRVILSFFAAILFASAALAVTPSEQLPDVAKEARARALSSELRCLVCQNQSIDDSDAPLAQDLRRLVRERIVAGDSDQTIRDFLVTRYGEFVLLKPPFSSRTLLLWLLPALALLLGGLAMRAVFRPRTTSFAANDNDENSPTPLSQQERDALRALVPERET